MRNNTHFQNKRPDMELIGVRIAVLEILGPIPVYMS